MGVIHLFPVNRRKNTFQPKQVYDVVAMGFIVSRVALGSYGVAGLKYII
ncbi:hypothetical protein APHNP_0541 [Anaplasma phagocytophilum str. ApNP]|uniref:Uncharacterized protein n=1 Tax=Anaplasma phagocytophilum str. ApNP TaxID=1359153 RepID=A0A0F3NH33_ANAPH|nr:hypothetical protein APHNP_0541 [Anaplasma phagocytophilum str. ApNP]